MVLKHTLSIHAFGFLSLAPAFFAPFFIMVLINEIYGTTDTFCQY